MNITEEIDATAWDNYVAGNPSASIYHQYAWRAFYEAYASRKTVYLAAVDDTGAYRGILPVVHQKSVFFGNYGVSLPFVNYGGVLADTPDICNRLMESCGDSFERTGATHVEFRDSSSLPGWPVSTHKVNMVLELPESTDELGHRLGAKRRSQIRRPLRENPAIDFGGVELLPGFYDVFSRNMRELGTPVYARSMFADILRRFPDAATIILVSIGSTPAAAGFLLRHGTSMEIPWASTNSAFNRISINMLMYWEALSHAINNGVRFFDFGRSSVDSGTYRFKKQWGAQPRQCYWHYWLKDGAEIPQLNPANSKYAMAIRVWQKMPLAATKLIGPSLVRHLP